MPTYTYWCMGCGKEHSRMRTIERRNKYAECPDCQGECKLIPSLTASRPDMTVREG